MAVQDGYGKSSGSESLVFAYDLKDTVNSFRGEPTTNQANTDYARTIQFHNQGGYNNAGTISEAPEKGPDWKKITITDRGTNFRIAQFPYIVQNFGTTKVYSVEYDFGSTSGYFFYGDGSSGFGVLQDDGKRVTARFTPPYATDWYEALFLGHNTPASNINDTIYYRNYQVEEKSYPTTYTPTSRSATQGLLDLTGNKTINLSSASFDNNAQIVFDGTDDYIGFGNTDMGLSGATQATMEIVVKIDQLKPTANAYQQVFGFRNNSDFDFFFLVFESSQNGLTEFRVRGQNGVVLDLNPNMLSYVGNYVHIVFTISTSARVVYFNGQSVASSTGWSSSFSASSIFDVGRYGAGNIWFFDGNIPVAKIYNRALTSTEVSNNYLKYKRQYGLT